MNLSECFNKIHILSLFLIFSLVIPSLIQAAELLKDPILRIETGMHTAKIRHISTDTSGRWLVTASDDKTLRVWELPSGRPVRVIRPPIGEGNEGMLYAVTLSPDGNTIACSGWTALQGERGHTICFLITASG